jgi:hypothetical protein
MRGRRDTVRQQNDLIILLDTRTAQITKNWGRKRKNWEVTQTAR